YVLSIIYHANTHFHTFSLHDALPIWPLTLHGGDRLRAERHGILDQVDQDQVVLGIGLPPGAERARPAERALAAGAHPLVLLLVEDRKSTRLNSSHVKISYAVFCLHIK